MSWLGKLKDFLSGCLDYENPSAGCCKSIGAIPGIQKEYKKTCENKDKNN